MKKILLLFTVFVFSELAGGSAYAQQSVTGKVINKSSQEPVTNASVMVKGTSIGTVTKDDGSFSINAPDAGVLVISSVGFLDQEVSIAGRSNVGVITLSLRNESLNEIVVTGYTSQQKKDITGAVTVVNVEDMVKQPTGQLSNQLQGQASGVTVLSSGQPGDEPQVTIRGINTFGNNTPLYIIDGVPTQNISTINPSDVASLQVLKDAGAASIYGSRASNGVIIITTKKGSGKVKVTYDGYYGTQRPKSGNVWHTLSPMETARLKFIALKNSGTPITPSNPDPLFGGGPEPVLPDYINPPGAKEGDPSVNPSLYYVDPNYNDPNELSKFYRITRANKEGTDWYHEVFKPAKIQNHNLSVSGSTEQGRYFFSTEYLDQDGLSIYTYLKRYTVRANTEFKVGNRVRIGENLAYSISNNYKINPDEDGQTGMAFRQHPMIPVYDIMGNFAGTYTGLLGNSRNPVGQAYRRAYNNKSLDNRLFGNIFADVDLLPFLTFHTSFGGESYSGDGHSFQLPEYENQENASKNAYSEGAYYGYNWTWTNTLNFTKTYDKHRIGLLAGVEAFESSYREVGGSTSDFFSFDPNFTSLSTGSGTKTNYSNRSVESLWSQFGRLDYSYNDRYLLSATIRRDGSSKFVNEQFGIFPAVTAAWRLSQEDFMKGVDWVTDLKIRAGYGIMGNQLNVNASNGFYTFTADRNASFYDIGGTNNSISQGFMADQIGNPDAKWERDINTNIGLDATLFNGKLFATIDLYKKDIKDLLYNPELPATAGSGTPPFVNIASMQNTGIDLMVGTSLAINPDMHFDASLSFTAYKNEVKRVTDDVDFFMSGDNRRFGQRFVRNQVGSSIGQFYGYKIDGFWNSQAEIDKANSDIKSSSGDPDATYQADMGVGRFRYADTNGDGQITDDDRVLLGNPNPDFNYGLNLGLTYKRFDISAFLYGSVGNDIWNNVRWYTDFYASFVGAKSHTALYNSWTPENHNAKAPIQENKGFTSTNGVPNSYYIEKGSYLRARNVTLGYTFAPEVLQKAFISSFRIYAQAANLFTITNYSGSDPEVTSTQGSSVTNFGIDEGAYPTPRTFILGVNLKF